jgi:hypothetical protein
LVGLNSILREAWATSQQTEDREKIQALSLAKECYGMKLDLLTNAIVVEDAIRFVAAANANNKESNIRTNATGNDKTEIEQENDIQLINLVNEDLQEQQVENNTGTTNTSNEVF